MSIERYMVDEIAIGAFIGDDTADGTPSFAAPLVVKARVEEDAKLIRKADGTSQRVTTWFATMDPIGPRDRVWIAPVSSVGARIFPDGFVFLDVDSQVPISAWNGGMRDGRDRHAEFYF